MRRGIRIARRQTAGRCTVIRTGAKIWATVDREAARGTTGTSFRWRGYLLQSVSVSLISRLAVAVHTVRRPPNGTCIVPEETRLTVGNRDSPRPPPSLPSTSPGKSIVIWKRRPFPVGDRNGRTTLPSTTAHITIAISRPALSVALLSSTTQGPNQGSHHTPVAIQKRAHPTGQQFRPLMSRPPPTANRRPQARPTCNFTFRRRPAK